MQVVWSDVRDCGSLLPIPRHQVGIISSQKRIERIFTPCTYAYAYVGVPWTVFEEF